MCNSNGNYKLVYLWFYAINIFISISLILIKYLDLSSSKLLNWTETGICCFGILMLLSLWSKAFIANQNYKGKYTINSRITKLFTFALVIIECMVVYYASFNHSDFLKMCCVSLIIWIAGICITVLANKRFIIRNYQS